VVTFQYPPVDLHLRVQRTVGGVEPGSAGDYRILLAQQVGDIVVVRQQRGSDIAAADVFGQGPADIGVDFGSQIGKGKIRHGRLLKVAGIIRAAPAGRSGGPAMLTKHPPAISDRSAEKPRVSVS